MNTSLYCVTDGDVIYSTGSTPEQAMHGLREQTREDREVREGYYHDGVLSLVMITPELCDRVHVAGGNIVFDIVGHGHRAIAREPELEEPK